MKVAAADPVALIDVDMINALVFPDRGRAIDVKVLDILWGTATKVRLHIGWDEAGRSAGTPSRLILKGGFAEHREEMAFLYRHEARFYRDIQPKLGIHTPLCIGTGYDARLKQEFALIEDLDAAGARFFRVVSPIDEQQARAYLDILAKMHARTWESDTFEPGQQLSDLHTWAALPMDGMGEYARGQLEPDVWQQYMALPRCLAVSRQFHDRNAMRRALERIDSYTRDKPRCLLHGDFHLGNLYTDAAGRPCVLDWQSYCIGHWSHDVTCFLVSALDMADRRAWDQSLIRYYLERLEAHGLATPPSFDEALEAFRIQLADYLFYWMVNPPEWQAEENNCAVAPRYSDAALDYGTFGDL